MLKNVLAKVVNKKTLKLAYKYTKIGVRYAVEHYLIDKASGRFLK